MLSLLSDRVVYLSLVRFGKGICPVKPVMKWTTLQMTLEGPFRVE